MGTELSLKPGRELDAFIAEKVMGLVVCRNKKGGWSIGEPDYYDSYGELVLSNPLPNYSTDIAAAWEVVEHLHSRLGCSVSVRFVTGCHPIGWSCEIKGPALQRAGGSTSSTAPHAVCLAARRAVWLIGQSA